MVQAPKFNVSLGVNFSDIMRGVAKEMHDKGQALAQQQREADERYKYERKEEYFLIARIGFDGSCHVETVAPVLNFGVLSARGPSEAGALAEMRMLFARRLHERKHDYDVREDYDKAKHWEQCRERAAKAEFRIADRFGKAG